MTVLSGCVGIFSIRRQVAFLAIIVMRLLVALGWSLTDQGQDSASDFLILQFTNMRCPFPPHWGVVPFSFWCYQDFLKSKTDINALSGVSLNG